MATQTQTIKRPPVQAERPHDYLYDPHYIVAGERDHAKATFQAQSTERVKRVAQFPTMFSELRHHPRFGVRLANTDPVPTFISRQWRGSAQQNQHTSDPALRFQQRQAEDPQIAGPNRYKYFRRPIIPYLQQMPPDVVLAGSRQGGSMGGLGLGEQGQGSSGALLHQGGAVGGEERPRTSTPGVRTVMTQTDYRESETQTDPYTPEYVLRPGSQPELLTLATLSYGRGLPAGLAEVEMIERARAKRAWEATLPPLNDVTQLEKRRKMMDDMERQEWAVREAEIEKLQEARLDVLKKLLKEREEKHQELNTKRLDRLWAKKQEEKEERVKKIRNEHIKMIRKLTERRRKVEGRVERRDITSEYADPGSQAFAPLTRIGVFIDRNSEQFVVKSRYLNTYEGLCELEASLPDFVTAPRIRAPKPRSADRSGFTRRKYRHEKELAEIHQVMKENRLRKPESPQPPRFLQKIEKPIPRPPTPTLPVPSEEEEERELATIMLQQVIRGRAVQNMMFEGKEKRIELIDELRSTHALQEAEQDARQQRRLATLAAQRQRTQQEHEEALVDEGLSQMEGESLGNMLDFLSKELIRLQEERRIHAYSLLAERRRRLREAEESGRRQVEQRLRRQHDEVFKQVVKVHQGTVDGYLEDIIMGAVDDTAETQARREIKQFADKINDVAYEMEDKRTELESEEIVSELVHSFLLPEVQKTQYREKIRMQQRKYLVAAHNEIHKEGDPAIEAHPTPTQLTASSTSRPGSSAEEKPSSRAGSGTSRQGSGTSRQGSGTSRAGSGTSRQGSGTSRPGSGTSRQGSGTSRGREVPGCETSRQGSGTSRGGEIPECGTSRPASEASRRGSGTARSGSGTSRSGVLPGSTRSDPKVSSSRKASATSVKSNQSGKATPEKQPSLDLSIQGRGSRPASQANTPEPPTPKGSKTATPQASRAATPQGSRAATPQGSKHTTPRSSRAATPQQSKERVTPQITPVGSARGSKTPTPQNSATTPPRSTLVSPVTSKPPTPQGSRTVTPRQVTSSDSKPGSRPPSRNNSVHSNK